MRSSPRRRRTGGIIGALAAVAAVIVPVPGSAPAAVTIPKPDITKMDYTPIGFYKPGDPIPSPLDPPKENNPSGKWVSYDTNVFESLNYPSRHPGDTSANDPVGTGFPIHGFCPPHPDYPVWGLCHNHQLEYLDYFEREMKEILGEFGVVVHRYPFSSPGTGARGGLFDAAGGQSYNISATVPGADFPDETVLVSGHYDFTDSGPAAAWDSAEGHTMVIRIAAIMADYWRKTGTRPSATVKFIPWDSEESGTFGSIDYVQNNIPPGEEHKVRGYFNMDPCAGAYPAFRNGNPASRVPEVLQLADPAAWDEEPEIKARIEAFNERALTIVDEVFDNLDDHLTSAPGAPEIFVSDAEAEAGGPPSQRGEIVTALGGLAAFSSDYANFESVGIPIFNLFPDYFGPHADLTPASAEGVTILHTPRDNLTTINALTSSDPSGMTASEGWMKGQEMCAHIEGWYMLQPEMGGAQTANRDPVAYYEALPNEAMRRQKVTFDATGSYQYANVAGRALVPDSALEYRWNFGDGTAATGRVVRHAYRDFGRYVSTLTVRNKLTGQQDTMALPVEVVPSRLLGPVLKNLPETDEDGTFTLEWSFEGEPEGLSHFSVEEATDLQQLLGDDAEGDLERLWTASETGFPTVQPWQSSNGSLATNGNKRHSGESSYWTGVVPPVPSPDFELGPLESILTLKEPIAVPVQGETRLTYWSLFQSEGDDEGRVEVAIDDGDPATELQWETVDGVGGFFAPIDTTVPPVDPSYLTAELEQRLVELGRFRGKNVLVRFRYMLGGDERALSMEAGWYVDDILMESGSWKEIGTTKEKSLDLQGKPKDLLSYRVRAVYADFETAPSNSESLEITKGVTPPQPPRVKGTKTGRVLPGTGVGSLAGAGLALLVAAAGLMRTIRRRT